MERVSLYEVHSGTETVQGAAANQLTDLRAVWTLHVAGFWEADSFYRMDDVEFSFEIVSGLTLAQCDAKVKELRAHEDRPAEFSEFEVDLNDDYCKYWWYVEERELPLQMPPQLLFDQPVS
jgi:hypothetical protein